MNPAVRSGRVVAACFASLLAVVVVGCSPSPASVERNAVVFAVSGEVTGTRAGQPARFSGGEQLVSDDAVTTAGGAFALLLLGNGWLTRIDAATSVRVGSLVAFSKAATSTPAVEQLARLVDASERDRLPADSVLAERVAGVEQRLHAATTVPAQVALQESKASSSPASAVAAQPAAAPTPEPMANDVDVARSARAEADRLGSTPPPPSAGGSIGRVASAAKDEAPPPPKVSAGASAEGAQDEAPAAKKDAQQPVVDVRLLDAASGEAPAGTPTMDVLRAARERFAGCAQGASGAVTVVFAIGVDGRVQDVSVPNDTTGVARVRACVADVVRRTPLPTRRRPVTLKIEVRFGPAASR